MKEENKIILYQDDNECIGALCWWGFVVDTKSVGRDILHDKTEL